MNCHSRLGVGIALLALNSAPAFAAAPTIKDFARLPEYSLARISPTGEYLAAAVPRGNKTGVIVIRLSDMKPTGAASWDKLHVNNLAWVSGERLVMGFAESNGPLDRPNPTGDLLAMDFDGSNRRVLGDRQDFVGVHKHAANESPAAWTLIAARTKIRNEVLVSRNSYYLNTTPTVHRIDTVTGKVTGVAESPVNTFTYFLADHDGELRYAVATDEKTLVDRTFVWSGSDDRRRRWAELGTSAHERSVVPLQISRDGTRAYVRARDGTDRYCLNEQELGSKVMRALACHDRADLDRVVFSSDRDVPIAALFEAGVPEIKLLNPEHPDTKLVKSLVASFPGQAVLPMSWSDDGSKLLFVVHGDRNPGEFFLYDRKAGAARYLMALAQWIDPDMMAQVKPLIVKSRSGEDVYAYMTLPPGKPASKLPMVVMPHGGPIGVRDQWGWHPDAQFMASLGYAVLQVNFHGSGGYGYKYQESAKRLWGTLMIDDITDVVRSTIAGGTVDERRICIYGGSYGGYASLMSAVREPDLYQCAIGYVGVYDLAMLKRDTDIAESKAGRVFMDRYIGNDPKQLAEHSPITYIDKLKAPIFIVHGEKDPRAPFNQATLLRSALEKRKHPYEWYTEADEEHGFYNEDNREELYVKMKDFLDRHIGERRPGK